MSDLYRLVYASKNLLQGSDPEIAHAVSQILAASQRNNTRVDVTGALMFNAGAFAQVLEGPRQGVESTFERIQCDPRHGDVTVLQCGPAESRSFTNWSMAFVGQSATGRTRWEGLASASGFDLTRLDGDAVFAMLHELVLDEEGLPGPSQPVPVLPAQGSPIQELPVPANVPEELPARAGKPGAGKPGAGMDVERVRAELPQLGAAPQAKQDAAPMRPAEAKAAPAASRDADGASVRPDAVLAVLRSALAQERRLTTDLRNELDELRIALALQQEHSAKIHNERDLWAKRAQLLATAMSQEASAVRGSVVNGEGVPAGASPQDLAGPQDRTGPSIKAVA